MSYLKTTQIVNLIRETKIPDIPSTQGLDPAIKKVVDPLIETMRVRLGRAGDAMDQGVTWRDLYQNGMVKVIQNGQENYIPGGGQLQPVNPILMDMTIPPEVDHLLASGAFTTVVITFDAPMYRNHAYTEIWRSNDNNLANAALIGTTRSAIYSDAVGTGSDKFYWARNVSTANVKGPFNAVDGVEGKTSPDPTYVLSVLQGQIDATHLTTDLAGRIDLVDAPANIPNSVAYQVQQEAISRANADDSLNSRIDQITSGGGTTLGNNIYSQASAPTASKAGDIWFDTAHNNQVNYWDGGQWVLVRDSGIPANASAISNEATTRANADTSLTNQVNALTSTVNTNNTNQTASINSEASTRASADSALGGRIDSLTTTVTNNYNTLSSNVTTETNARTSGDQTNANAITSLKSSLSDANGNQLVTAAAWTGLNNTVSTQGNSITSNANAISSLKTSLSDANGNQTVTASAWSSLNTTVSSQGNSITANTTSINTLTNSVNGNTSSIQTLQSVQNGLVSQYMVKLDTNGYVSGFGLYNNGSSSSFVIRTDTFALVPAGAASGASKSYPFMVGTVAGVSTVGINGQLIVDGTITGRMIQAGSIGADRIYTTSLDAFTANMGTLTSGLLKSPDGRVQFDLTNELLRVNDGTQDRVYIGKIGTGYGISLYDASGNLLLDSSGNGQLPNVTVGHITGQGPFATLSQIDQSNVQTYIANAAVNTLQLAGQCVTIPVSAYTEASILMGTSWTTLQQATINSSGAPINISFSILVGGNAGNTASIYIQVVRDGTVIYNITNYTLPSYSTYDPNNGNIYHTQPCQFSASLLDTAGTGTHTYYINAYVNNVSRYVFNRSLVLLETKR